MKFCIQQLLYSFQRTGKFLKLTDQTLLHMQHPLPIGLKLSREQAEIVEPDEGCTYFYSHLTADDWRCVLNGSPDFNENHMYEVVTILQPLDWAVIHDVVSPYTEDYINKPCQLIERYGDGLWFVHPDVENLPNHHQKILCEVRLA